MKYIDTFEELRNLPNSTEVHRIANGYIKTFIIIGTITSSSGIAVANKESLKDMKFLHEIDFKGNLWTTDNDLREIGLVLVSQIAERERKAIEDIQYIYLS